MSPQATPGLAPSAAVDPAAFAIGGRAPRFAWRPADADQVGEVMRTASRDGLAVVPWGAGVALTHEAPPSRYDVALDLSALDRVVEYDPEDFTLTAQCGATIASLRATLAARRQELPLEAALAPRATLGGVLAADASGPRRLRFGAPHDRILGARFVLADGTQVRSGGKVVKNVAGYGSHRLLCGSRGGLAVMVEASLKLAPTPGARVALCYGTDRAHLTESARWAAFPRLELSLLTVVEASLAAGLASATAAPYTVVIGLEDDRARVSELERTLTTALGAPASRIDGDAAAALWQSLADLEETAGPRLSFTTAANTASAPAPLFGAAAARRLLFHAPAGRLHLFPGPADAQAALEEATSHGFTLIGARGLGAIVPAPAQQTGLRALRARICAALDPSGTLVLGESWAAGAR